MRKGLTELVFILDRSGSMGGLESDTIGGFNSLIEKQRRQDSANESGTSGMESANERSGETYVSTLLFDDRQDVIYDRVPLENVRKMTEDDYYVRGCTALLDAVGGAIHHISNIHKYAREEDRPEKTLFIITTDGMENASHRYTYKEVKKMVEHQKEKYGWEFVFLGANIDAAAEAERFGINASRAINYRCDEKGTALNFKVLSDVVGKVRSCKDTYEMEACLSEPCCFAEIHEDYAKRG